MGLESITENPTIGILGLGYVGLPLAVAFGRKYSTIGFDINHRRIEELKGGLDVTLEISEKELSSSHHLELTEQSSVLARCNVLIVTVPTPIDSYNQPDLQPLIDASKIIGGVISKSTIVIYESTVYPGATEEVCIPIVEASSGLKFNCDFFAGYSPERINPGDKTHRLESILKITSGSTPEVAEIVDQIYNSIITAGTHKASSIKVAEAAKVIENTQRDVNIALVNEFARLFNRLDIDTNDVLAAAKTKWNFLPFEPGLVGGHCIGVDPYYLTHKAAQVGYNPEMILAGRRMNDSMPSYIASELTRLMVKNGIPIVKSKILILGLAFKENCPDIRNSQVAKLVLELTNYGHNVDVLDPWVDHEIAKEHYEIEVMTNIEQLQEGSYAAVMLAVKHDQFVNLGAEFFDKYCEPERVVFDIKGALPKKLVDGRL